MQYRYIILLASLLAATPFAAQAAPHHRPHFRRNPCGSGVADGAFEARV